MRFVLLFCLCHAATGFAQTDRESSAMKRLREAWGQPVEAFQVLGNIYYVGAAGISSWVIASDQGLILIDTGTVEMVPAIAANIESLGFDVADIKIILSSHAHWDHVEGHAPMKRLAGARIMAVGEDAKAISAGVDHSALGGAGWEPAAVDRVLKNGDAVTLGNVTLHAHHTPGHTQGCTTWTTDITHEDKQLLAVFVGGTSVNAGVTLTDNARHPAIADDYRRTFRLLKQINADVFLAQHPSIFGMDAKRQRLRSGGTNPFVDPEGFQQFVASEEQEFVARLQAESAQASP